jgi:hypothetical protein
MLNAMIINRRVNVSCVDEKEKTVFYGNISASPEGDFIEFPQCTYSDYSGYTMQRANTDTILKKFKDLEGVYEIWGGHGTRGVIITYALYLENEEIQNIITDLENYPVIDDDARAKLEEEIEDESWDTWIKDSLISELDKADIEYPEDNDELVKKFYTVINDADIEIIFEDAVSCYIDIEKVVANWQ